MSQLEQQILNLFKSNTQQALQAYDFNRDGVIDQNEMMQVLLQSGCDRNSATQITRDLFNQLDVDRNGYLTIGDFQAQVNSQQSAGQLSPFAQQILNYFKSNIQQAMNTFDFNRDGVIDQNEMLQVLLQSGCDRNSATQITRDLFNQLDVDRNGYLTLKEFQ